MSKSNTTENDLVKFVANATPMPAYGASLYVHIHTADPGEAGTSSSSEASFIGYARVAVTRDAGGFTICDSNGTPNASGSAFKNTAEVTFPECTGVADDVDVTHASLCTGGGQILYSGALTAGIKVTNLTTVRFPAGTMIFAED